MTHRDMERYFMSKPEAVALVIEAGAIARGGEVFCLDMGDPVRIEDLARTMIRQSGKNIELVFSGVRPGEKLAELLWEDNEVPTATSHPRIRSARLDRPHGSETQRIVNVLARLVETRNEEGLRSYLIEKLCAATPKVTPELTQLSLAKARAAAGW